MSANFTHSFTAANTDEGVTMEHMLKDAQRILNECGENHLHPANNNRHPLHRQALKAIAELEEKIMVLTDRNRPPQKSKK
jgi:hypothetical protein